MRKKQQFEAWGTEGRDPSFERIMSKSEFMFDVGDLFEVILLRTKNEHNSPGYCLYSHEKNLTIKTNQAYAHSDFELIYINMTTLWQEIVGM